MRLLGEQQEQSGGPGSTNLQAGRDIVYTGMSYDDVRQISLDLIHANLFAFQTEMERVVEGRVKQFVDLFIERMRSESPEAIEGIKDADVQFSLVAASRDYARTGDPELGDVLVDLLARRCAAETRTLMAVVLNDAITTASRLTSKELSILTLAWKLFRTKYMKMTSLDALRDYLRDDIEPYVDSIPTGDATYLHLQYLGCALVNPLQSVDLPTNWRMSYSGIFAAGFSEDEVPIELRQLLPDQRIFVRCLRDKAKWQVNATDEDVVRGKARDVGRPELADALVNLQHEHLLSVDEVRAALVAANQSMERVFFLLEKTPLQKLTLTSVGIAIAHANDRRLTKQNTPLAVWIADEAPAL